MGSTLNFGPGPAVLPSSVLEQVQQDVMDYRGRGLSILEINHRDDDLVEILEAAKALYRELLAIPDNYAVMFIHGGAAMQFTSVPVNLLGLHPKRKMLVANSGYFSTLAFNEASRYGDAQYIASSESTGFDRVPEIDPAKVDADASYLHICTNNTMMGTRWQTFPAPLPIPLVGDATSEILSRPMDISQFGLLFAGFQKNLGTAGTSVIIIREDLLGHPLPEAPRQLNYNVLLETNSMPTTPGWFNIYVNRLVLEWTRDQGGPQAMAELNERKAARVYGVIDRSDFYTGHAHPAHRSRQNYTFGLPSKELLEKFFSEASEAGLYGLKSPPMREDVRASMYNAMPYEGAETLAAFMEDFERRHG